MKLKNPMLAAADIVVFILIYLVTDLEIGHGSRGDFAVRIWLPLPDCVWLCLPD